MKDDLFERLRTVDPATEERILHEARALGNTPRRIADSEPTNVRRFPKGVRRKATIAAVAAVVVVAIALPLALLRSLGDGSSDGDLGNWVSAGALGIDVPPGVTYVPELDAFLVGSVGGEPLGLSAIVGGSSGDIGQRAIYCEASDRFVLPTGDVFDGTGIHLAGPGASGMDRFAVRVLDGVVQVDRSAVTAAPGGSSEDAIDLQDTGCQTASGIPLEGEPGFAIPSGTELPPIAVALPQTGAFVQSPITITGSANVFEATVSIRVLDADGEVIAQAFTTATCGTGCRGEFSTQVEVPVDTEQPGTIQVFESSAQDGSMINAVEIPVTLLPGLAPGTSNVEGVWYDGDGAALPDGSPDSMGMVLNVFRGDETHCQWGSATFMHIGWPLGTAANSLGGWRQYVRDPDGLFDDRALYAGYLSDTSLPADAFDTGYHRGPWHLWVDPSQPATAVFVVNADTGTIERWGGAQKPIRCE
jgi:hypothetical protein